MTALRDQTETTFEDRVTKLSHDDFIELLDRLPEQKRTNPRMFY